MIGQSQSPREEVMEGKATPPPKPEDSIRAKAIQLNRKDFCLAMHECGPGKY